MKIFCFILTFFMATLIWQSCGYQPEEKYTNLSPDEFEHLIENKDVQCVDVRTVAEYSEGHIPGSLNINVLDKQFIDNADKILDRNHPVAVYCKSGRRSRNAAKQLEEKGFKVYNLDTGFEGWEKNGKNVDK